MIELKVGELSSTGGNSYSKNLFILKEKIWNSKEKYSESIDWEGYLRRAIVNLSFKFYFIPQLIVS